LADKLNIGTMKILLINSSKTLPAAELTLIL